MISRSWVMFTLVVLLTGFSVDAAVAQNDKAPKGVKSKGLVTSLGSFRDTVNMPVFVTGATVEIEPGGQTGREQFRVPTYVYVIEGTLTTDYEAGPVGIKGAQYHAAGQSFMAHTGWWHNHMNRTDKPVKYLMLHLGYPNHPAAVQKAEPE
jgi:quercetin dioxygenase-like cupin family protein